MPHPPAPPHVAAQDKLYLVTRDDLSAGAQLSQTVHAAADFCFAHPAAAARWHATAGHVVVLTVPDETALHALASRAAAAGITVTAVHEPDLGGELTALAFAPDPATRTLLSSLPLAGRRLAAQEPLAARERALRQRWRP